MELGVAQGTPWGILIVAYAVLLPSTQRHAVTRTATIAAIAFVPELILLPGVAATADREQLLAFLFLKLFIIAVMSALALYGSYRIEKLGQEAEVTRELGQYLLQRMIGEGGMGSVYLAEHRLLRRPCAVKLIRAEQAADDLALARFEREVQSAATLTHPNTVQIYDYGQSEEGTFYFAMEFLPGITLDELVERHGAVPAARAVHILTQLCGALHEAHSAGSRTAMLTIMSHVNEAPAPVAARRPEVPNDLSEVLLRCLAKKPEDRFPDVMTLERALASSVPVPWSREDALRWWRSR